MRIFVGLLCAMEVLSKMEKTRGSFVGSPVTLYRRGYQTTLRCYDRKGMVVNGQRKAFVKKGR